MAIFLELAAHKERQQLNQELQEVMRTLQYGKWGADGVNTGEAASVREVGQGMLPDISGSDEVSILSSDGIYNPFGERALSHTQK